MNTHLIKRYGNRKLYDTQASAYITLDGIADLVREGKDLRVIDNDSGEDLTAVTFAQIIFEEEKRKTGLLSLPVLRWIIHQGGEALHEILERVDRGREAIDSARESVEKGVQQLVGRTRPGKKGLLEEILEAPQKQLDQLQKRIDTQVRESVDRFTSHPAIQREITRLERSVKRLESQLSRLRRKAPRARRTKAAS
ncbi:MAG TPA: polyhydroxyalkanoate synthesis regulator DNA-binding domain-containing protein [Candidatus Binatia bacterium]|nr:polyhydroxyalkanoate synthesis regulator DNA-binding domain-containing protein [Candidatus Binatia bacterium]